MSLNNYKKIRIRSGGERVLYFDGSGATGTLFPVFSDTFDVRINQDDLTNRDLLVTNDTTARVDVQGLDNQSSIRIDLKVYSYQLLDEIEDDGGTDIDEDYSHSVYGSLSGYSLASSCSQSKADVLYAGTGSYAAETYQLVFTDGDKIITGIETDTGEWNDLPSNTSRIEIKPFDTAVKLPVRAKDIANDEGQILDTVAIVGTSGSVADRIQYLNDSGSLTRDETTDDANVYRPAPSAVTLSAGTYNNYALIDGANIFISGSGAKILTGIVADAGREVTITCSQGTLQLNHLDTNSSIVNRFNIAGEENLILQEYDSVTLSYQLTFWLVKNNYVRSNQVNPVIELTALTNDADDYAIGDGTFFSVSMGAAYAGNDITGFAGGVDGREIEIINRGGDAIDVQHQNAGSTAENRIISPTGADIILNQYDTVRLRYYAGSIDRWVIVGSTY